MKKETFNQKPNAEAKTGYVKASKTENKLFNGDNLRLDFKAMKTLSDKPLGSTDKIFLAIKDETTYMAAITSRGFKLVSDNNQIYSKRFSRETRHFRQVLYINHLDCFLILLPNGKLYKKDIDQADPYPFLELNELTSGYQYNLKYSTASKKLILLKDWVYIAVFNLERKKEEVCVSVQAHYGDPVIDFKIFGKEENMVVSATRKGHLNLHIFNLGMKKVLATNHFEIKNVSKDKNESLNSISACGVSEYFAVEVGSGLFALSRILVFRRSMNRLIKMAELDLSSQKISESSGLRFGGQAAEHFLWVVFNHSNPYVTQFYHYNSVLNELREVDKRKTYSFNALPRELHRINNVFFYPSSSGCLITLNLTF